ncbi:maleylpyruvate isomerase N-terminal domain-containing protein [Brevibacterium daeguense]|uniref:Maleylpyruvate isomerase N-terminal domain-containing protein n=1 Tax=Brevibacterium daeguense TaxID=909936 RepID=A0ABP8EKJ9_9MICO|nr:DinB family protein [Brevibacterium daeguense]
MAEHGSIEPDTRDWAEVLEQGCPDCGFTGREEVSGASAEVSAAITRWEKVLARPTAAQRPRPGRWSDVEYAAHVRDILTLFRNRLLLMLNEEDPVLPNFDGDAVAVAEDYPSQDPGEVLTGLRDAASDYSSALAAIGGAQWNRTGHREDGRAFTVTTLTRYGLHELRHHLLDVSG